MQIQLLYFPGCPHVEATRRALAKALGRFPGVLVVSEIDVTDPSTSPNLRSWGSPTILVNGADVEGGTPSASSCRLYPGSDDPGAPSLDVIEAAIDRALSR